MEKEIVVIKVITFVWQYLDDDLKKGLGYEHMVNKIGVTF
jgi:hypothetical protein